MYEWQPIPFIFYGVRLADQEAEVAHLKRQHLLHMYTVPRRVTLFREKKWPLLQTDLSGVF
jgi:hypothetical protein